MRNIWQELKRPIKILAPMEDVTDSVFRRVVCSWGKPDLFFSEFTSADGLCSAGREEVMHRLHFAAQEKPIIAQIWGNNPESYRHAARSVAELGFDGIDINMGCPVPKIVKMGACSALIKNRSLAQELILAAKEGAGHLPVSIKTRTGFSYNETERWVRFLLELRPAALTIHGRTAAQLSRGEANWEEIRKAVAIRNDMQSETIIIGNGDVTTRAGIEEKYTNFGVDGVMVGRGIFCDLSLFATEPGKQASFLAQTRASRIEALIVHMQLFEQTWQGQKSFGIMKKFFKLYISGFEGASELRSRLVRTRTVSEAVCILTDESLNSGCVQPASRREILELGA